MNYIKIFTYCLLLPLCACRHTPNAQNTEGVQNAVVDGSKAFAQRFPQAQDVYWDTLETGVSAKFSNGKYDCIAYFDLKGGFLYATTFIERTSLPASVQQFLTDKYKGIAAAVLMSVEKPESKSYKIELETDTDYITLEFDANGKMLSEKKHPLSNEELQRQEEEGVE